MKITCTNMEGFCSVSYYCYSYYSLASCVGFCPPSFCFLSVSFYIYFIDVHYCNRTLAIAAILNYAKVLLDNFIVWSETKLLMPLI